MVAHPVQYHIWKDAEIYSYSALSEFLNALCPVNVTLGEKVMRGPGDVPQMMLLDPKLDQGTFWSIEHTARGGRYFDQRKRGMQLRSSRCSSEKSVHNIPCEICYV